jgi:hypothetical protein
MTSPQSGPASGRPRNEVPGPETIDPNAPVDLNAKLPGEDTRAGAQRPHQATRRVLFRGLRPLGSALRGLTVSVVPARAVGIAAVLLRALLALVALLSLGNRLERRGAVSSSRGLPTDTPTDRRNIR